jgi:hypothetical protein
MDREFNFKINYNDIEGKTFIFFLNWQFIFITIKFCVVDFILFFDNCASF